MTNDLYKSRDIARQVAAFIAEALTEQTGDSYAVDTSERVLEHWGAYIDGPDDIRLFVSPRDKQHRNSETRLTISGEYPLEAHEAIYRIDRHTISVARDRGPEAIAKEIVRRVLPGYRETLAEAKQAIARHNEGLQRQAEAVERLQGIATGAGGPLRVGRTTARADRDGMIYLALGDGYGDIRINRDGTTVELHLRSLPVEIAERMLKAAVEG